MSPADDRWASGNAYERYMGRWSRQIGGAFLEWLAPANRGNWLDVGCGTGALTETIGLRASPGSIGFDFIVSGLALNFFPDPLAAVRAMRQRLNPEGRRHFLEGRDRRRRSWRR